MNKPTFLDHVRPLIHVKPDSLRTDEAMVQTDCGMRSMQCVEFGLQIDRSAILIGVRSSLEDMLLIKKSRAERVDDL
jgi:hypothetical protein